MASHLLNIYGTEQDRVNCPFYFKIGACRHGERCNRLHNKPTESQTIIIMNMFQTPYTQYGPNSEPLFDVKAAQQFFDDFYEDMFVEMANYGEVEEIFVCRNLGDHLVGNVYVKYFDEADASKALAGIRNRYYGGRPLVCELSPVTDFREARCRQYDDNCCNRGGYCNFMHIQEPSTDLRDALFEWSHRVHVKKGDAHARDIWRHRHGGPGGGRRGPPSNDRYGDRFLPRDAGRFDRRDDRRDFDRRDFRRDAPPRDAPPRDDRIRDDRKRDREDDRGGRDRDDKRPRLDMGYPQGGPGMGQYMGRH